MSNLVSEKIDYLKAGVNRDEADRLVGRIEKLAKRTHVRLGTRVKSTVGGYAALFSQSGSAPLIAATTDGVGTKLKLAFRLNVHHTVGIDLVAMSVNDLLCVGAQPLFFLDYFATGKLDSEQAASVIEGIVEGCSQAGCVLVGGETAEMPDFYQSGEYDLAGFAVGQVSKNAVLPKKQVLPGDVIIGIGSSGFHSNGYSLLRKWIPEGESGESIARKLLTPTKIYVDSCMPLIKRDWVNGLAHITGSGFLNVPRISSKVSYQIRLPKLSELPSVFKWVKQVSQLSLGELAQTFNMGIGMVIVADKKNEKKILAQLAKSGEKAWVLGKVVSSRSKVCEVTVANEDEEVTLKY